MVTVREIHGTKHPEREFWCPRCAAFRERIYADPQGFTCSECPKHAGTPRLEIMKTARLAWPGLSEAARRLRVAQALASPIRFADWYCVTGLTSAEARHALMTVLK